MNCVEREDFQKSELFHIIYDVGIDNRKNTNDV